ncbi:MAG: hypothetical protein CVU63_06285 [Deltaproteobacteria bacterium HGW-Deltaproteobacteria-20]|nr:MAG: hypothetical protein CVU63_06285 [Deltaproteobacteria bacterium HGW-Deltaproteobacteria-20]
MPPSFTPPLPPEPPVTHPVPPEPPWPPSPPEPPEALNRSESWFALQASGSKATMPEASKAHRKGESASLVMVGSWTGAWSRFMVPHLPPIARSDSSFPQPGCAGCTPCRTHPRPSPASPFAFPH